MRKWGTRARALGAVTVLAVGSLVAIPAAGAQTTTTAPGGSGTTGDGLTVTVGANDPKDPNIAVLQYMPAEVAVPVGATVRFSWARTTEPHSVTFLAPGQQLPPPGSDPSLFVGAAPAEPYDGQTFVNSGLQPFGPGPVPPFAMTFATAGTYSYYCVIHPTMIGTIDVVDSGPTTTLAAAAAMSRAEQAEWIDEGRTAKAKLVAEAKAAKPTKGADGTRRWTVQMGTTTVHTDVLAFAPTPRRIRAGDSVTFVNSSGAPHTATFNGTSSVPIESPLDSRTDQAIPGPSPQTLTPDGQFNTAELPPDASAPGGTPPPAAARSFTFVVPTRGTYEYSCVLHVPSGMAGTITAR